MKIPARGFTLIELLVVIAIIGVLSSVVLASLNATREKTRNADRFSDMHAVVQALEMYANDHDGKYPQATGGVAGDPCGGASNQCLGNVPGLVPTYISSIPDDPRYMDSAGNYLYCSNTKDYYLIVRKEPGYVACSPRTPFDNRATSCGGPGGWGAYPQCQ